MFANDKKILEKIDTYISKGINLKGDLISQEQAIRIDGNINGDTVKAKGIIVGENANINVNNIEAEVIVIAGEIHGNVVARKKLEILEKSKIFGDIFSPNISILEGAVFEGQCKMLDNASLEKIQKENKKKEEK